MDINLCCPYCHRKLYEWKVKHKLTIYKCGNKKCEFKQSKIKALNPAEKMLMVLIPTHFKVNYQYREYQFTEEDLKHSEPKPPHKSRVNLSKIHCSNKLLGLILSVHISFSMNASKTAAFINQVYGRRISGKTILNYAEAAAPYCHKFNMNNKGPTDDISAGDETYIKIKGKHHYVWFFISVEKKTITAYHVSNNRETKPAITAMLEAIRTAKNDQKITLITDGNPSYSAGLHFINNEHEIYKNKNNKIKHIKVIGLQNLDKDSEDNRKFKQIIERLNRTYKQNAKAAAGFNKLSGAIAITTLFVTHYNFLRPHSSLDYDVPVPISDLNKCRTLPEKWLKILSLAA